MHPHVIKYIRILSCFVCFYNFLSVQGGGGARLTGHIQIEGNEDQLRATINDIEQRFDSRV